jgi:hypothetical protein
MLKNKCLYVIISIHFFSVTICNLLIDFPLYKSTSLPKKLCKVLSSGKEMLMMSFWFKMQQLTQKETVNSK